MRLDMPNFASAPVDGAHYFVDVAAGAVVGAVGIAIGARMPALAARSGLPRLSSAMAR